jgi:surface polysaccharide O-acyltransferase-like enzyme
MKVLAIFMVITLHNGTWHTDFVGTGNWVNLLQFSIRLVCEPVPIFMLINGFLMFHSKFDSKKHLQRIVNTVLIILCWSVIFDIFFTAMEGKPITIYGIVTSVLNTYIGNTHTGVLWFLQKLVVVYLVFPVLKYLYDTKYTLFKYLLLVLAVSTYSISLLSAFSTFIDSQLYSSFLFFLNQYSVVFTTNIYIVYFMVGGYLRRDMNNISHKRYISLGILSIVIITVLGIAISVYQGATCRIDLNYSQIFLLLTIMGLFLLCSHIPMNCSFVNKILASIGDNTMGIYLLHRMMISLVSRWLPAGSQSLLLRIALSLGVLLVCWGITVLIRKIPKVSFLVKL